MIEIITDQMRKLKEEIAALQLQDPPEKFSPIQIERFVNNLTTDFSVDTIHALIERVEITNKFFRINLTLIKLFYIKKRLLN